jgi:hypothetical protein
MKIRDGEAGKVRAAVVPKGAPFKVARTETARSCGGGVAPEELEIHHTLSADARRASLAWRKRMS